MGTRSATIIRQTTYRGEQAETKELMQFYRHCDGYPSGHGIDMAECIIGSGCCKARYREWLQGFLARFCAMPVSVEFEPCGCMHGDLEYFYVVEGIVDHRWPYKKNGELPITISVYRIGWNENYYEAEKREPLFSGSAYEYIEKFGKEQQCASPTD